MPKTNETWERLERLGGIVRPQSRQSQPPYPAALPTTPLSCKTATSAGE